MIADLIAADALGVAAPPAPDVDETVEAPAVRTARVQVGTSVLAWPVKDPDETLDFGNDIATRIADETDTIDTTQADVVDGGSGVTVVAHYVNPTAPMSTTTWLMGGTEGTTALLRVRSVTHRGRRIDDTVSLPIATR